MAKYSTGFTLGISKPQFTAVQLMTQGVQQDEIVKMVFDVRAEDGGIDSQKMIRGRATLRKWMKDPKVWNAYRELMREFIAPEYSRAVRKITSLIDDQNGWLARQAANDVLTHFGNDIMGTNSNEVVIRVEGGPTIGTPDTDE